MTRDCRVNSCRFRTSSWRRNVVIELSSTFVRLVSQDALGITSVTFLKFRTKVPVLGVSSTKQAVVIIEASPAANMRILYIRKSSRHGDLLTVMEPRNAESPFNRITVACRHAIC